MMTILETYTVSSCCYDALDPYIAVHVISTDVLSSKILTYAPCRHPSSK